MSESIFFFSAAPPTTVEKRTIECSGNTVKPHARTGSKRMARAMCIGHASNPKIKAPPQWQLELQVDSESESTRKFQLFLKFFFC